MSCIYFSGIRQDKQSALYAFYLNVIVSAGEVCSANAFAKQGVTAEEYAFGGYVETDAAGCVPRSVYHFY